MKKISKLPTRGTEGVKQLESRPRRRINQNRKRRGVKELDNKKSSESNHGEPSPSSRKDLKRLNHDRCIVDPSSIHFQSQHSGHPKSVFTSNSPSEKSQRHVILLRPRFRICHTFWRVTRYHAVSPILYDPCLTFAFTQICETVRGQDEEPG